MENQVCCQVIPGVSSAIAVPEYFGIPVTHRGIAQSFCVITGHQASGEGEDYEALAKLKGTLVFLMGKHRITEIAEELMRYGKDPKTPVAILSRGFLSGGSRLDATLQTVAQVMDKAQTPAVFLVGHTAKMRLLDSDESPKMCTEITVTGTESFTKRVQQANSSTEIFVRRAVTLQVVSQPQNIPNDFSPYRWLVFTSANGVDVFFDYIFSLKMDLRSLFGLKFACIGDGTARQLQQYGFTADFKPDDYTIKALAEEFPKVIKKDEQALILRSAKGAKSLTEEWTKAGVKFKDSAIYDTIIWRRRSSSVIESR